jgi:MFS family permease
LHPRSIGEEQGTLWKVHPHEVGPGLLFTLALSALDATIVGTALPTIVGALYGFDQYSWVVTAYLLTSTTVVPIVGKLSDQFGRKGFVLIGIVLFLLGSALAGTAQPMTQLILFRGLQGLGAGFMQTLAFTVVADLFPPAERGRWQGLFASVLSLVLIVAPALGGWITAHAGWRWVFYVNMPVGSLALLLLSVWLPPGFRHLGESIKGGRLGTVLISLERSRRQPQPFVCCSL